MTSNHASLRDLATAETETGRSSKQLNSFYNGNQQNGIDNRGRRKISNNRTKKFKARVFQLLELGLIVRTAVIIGREVIFEDLRVFALYRDLSECVIPLVANNPGAIDPKIQSLCVSTREASAVDS